MRLSDAESDSCDAAEPSGRPRARSRHRRAGAAPRIDRAPEPVHVHTHAVAEAEQPLSGRAAAPTPRRRRRASKPRSKETTPVGSVVQSSRATARARNPPKRKPRVARAYRGRNDHDASAREQLEVDAGAAVERSGDAQTVHTPASGGSAARCRSASGTSASAVSERKHLRHAIPLAAVVVAVLAGCGGGSGTKQGGITVQPAHEYRLDQLRVVHPTVGKPAVLSFRDHPARREAAHRVQAAAPARTPACT